MADWLAHPVIAPIVAGLTLGILVWIARRVGGMVTETRELRVDLRLHMANEESERSLDLAEREGRQAVLDTRLAAIEEGVDDLRASVGTVHRRIDDALAGNPEVRREGRA